MPPPMPNPSKRMTANPARPVARYRPGKAVQEESSDEFESENEVEEQSSPKPAHPKAISFPAGAQRRQPPPRQALKENSDDEEGFVTDEDEEDDASGVTLPTVDAGDGARRITSRSTATAISRTAQTVGVSSTDEEESGQSEEESEDEEDSSSEEEPQRKFQRPTFIKKSDRGKVTSSAANTSHTATDGVTSTSAPVDAIQAEELRRKEMADLMIKDKLERDAAARAAGRKGWDDDDEVAAEDMVDDTDGLDPEAEYASWKLRELKRLKRDREAIEQREKEIEEIERRRNLSKAEREAEDREYLEQQKEDREEARGKAGFLQRYHHKGAFFQDDETAEILRKRDLMGAKFVDEVRNREALPQYMQVRDMTKLGKKGRTRYTDLKGEDTGSWGQGYDQRERTGPKLDLGVDERFRPDHDGGGKGPTGANAYAVRDRRDTKVDGALKGPRAMDNGNNSRKGGDGGNSDRPRKQSDDEGDDGGGSPRRRSPSLGQDKSPSRPRSRSIGGYRDRGGDVDGRSRRKRSPSPYRDGDKRRRVEA
jgi:microfibrillar-associated protein 1